MVICELCNGSYHGTCLEPPLYEIPEEDWICPVCAEHMVEGVFDAVTCNPGFVELNTIIIEFGKGLKFICCGS